jgi:hypothetical protein
MLKKRWLDIVLLLVASVSALGGYAQNSPPFLNWGKQLGSVTNEGILDLGIGAGGNLVVAGWMIDSLDIDPDAGENFVYSDHSMGNFIASYAQNGSLLWGKSILSAGPVIFQQSTVDLQGNIYWTALAGDTLFFDPDSTNAFLPVSTIPYHMTLVKFSPNGNFLWGHVFEGPPGNVFRDVKTDDAGAVYLAGLVYGSTDLDPGPGTQILSSDPQDKFDFLLKLDASGKFNWVRSWKRGPLLLIGAIQFDGTDAISIAGAYSGNLAGDSIDMDPGPGTYNILPASAAVSDGFLMQVDTAGNFRWVQTVEGPGTMTFRCISATVNNEFLVSGEFTDSMTFSGVNQSILAKSNGAEDGFIAKYDVAGNLNWVGSMGGGDLDLIYDVVHDQGGRIFAIGIYADMADYSFGSVSGQLTSIDSADGLLIRLAPNGNLLYAGSMGGQGTDLPSNLVKDDNSGLFVSGAFRFDVDISPDNSQVILNSVGGWDIFIANLTEVPLVAPSTMRSSVLVVPNPSQGSFRVDWTETGRVNISIYDLSGRLRHQENRIVSGAFPIRTDLPDGAYILDLQSQKQRLRGTLVIHN